jgi:hypothetical protein
MRSLQYFTNLDKMCSEGPKQRKLAVLLKMFLQEIHQIATTFGTVSIVGQQEFQEHAAILNYKLQRTYMSLSGEK